MFGNNNCRVLEVRLSFGGVFMIWLILFTPILILGAIAIYFDKKSGMIPPDEVQLRGKITEYPPEHFNSSGPSNF